MFDTLLKYVTLLTLGAAAIKYFDQRKLQERTRRSEIFGDLMSRIAAETEKTDKSLPRSAQAAAIYELQFFPEYSYASVPILTDLRQFFVEANAPALLINSVDASIEALKSYQEMNWFSRRLYFWRRRYSKRLHG